MIVVMSPASVRVTKEVMMMASVKFTDQAMQELGITAAQRVGRAFMLDDIGDSEYQVLGVLEMEGSSIRIGCRLDGIIDAVFRIDLLNEAVSLEDFRRHHRRVAV
jgi:hypothetical protein